jgi:hypothetical protein
MTSMPAPEPDRDEAPIDDPFDDPDLTKHHDLPPEVPENAAEDEALSEEAP